MKILTTITIALFFLTGMTHLFARSFRVDQVPNGNKYSCSTCHTGLGGPRNAFGTEIENNYLDNPGNKSNANVVWSAALAALDSDGDGVNNGAELQDANGVWKIGESQPGDRDLVSNPGDPGSTTNIALALETTPFAFQLSQNYPNPFNPSTSIVFTLTKTARISLRIYNSQGVVVRELFDQEKQPGEHITLWDGMDGFGRPVSSGIYLAQLNQEDKSQIIRMLLIR